MYGGMNEVGALLRFVGKARLLRLRRNTRVDPPDMLRVMLAGEIQSLLIDGELLLKGKGDVLWPVAPDLHRRVLVERLGQAGDDLQARFQRVGAVFDFDDFKDLRFYCDPGLIRFFFGGFGSVPGIGEGVEKRGRLGHVMLVMLCSRYVKFRL